MKIAGRTLTHEASAAIRRMAVRRVQEGERPSAVIRAYGLCRTVSYKWLRAAKRGGEAALAARQGTGRPDQLRPRQKQQVRRWICGQDPRQYGFDFGLWTRKIVAALIRAEDEGSTEPHLGRPAAGRTPAHAAEAAAAGVRA